MSLLLDVLQNAQVFGEVPANKNLCLANGHIEVQFSGNFGDPAVASSSSQSP